MTRVIKTFESFYLGKCRCGCGHKIPIRNKRGFLKQFVKLHNFKGNHNPSYINPKTRDKNHSWKGGIRWSRGYLEIKIPNYHFLNSEGYVKLHRFVYEYFNKCCLLPWIHVHHINRITTDNHKNNLLAVSSQQHRTIHNLKDFSDRYCIICKSTKTYIRKRNNSPLWLKHQDGFICKWCYDKGRYL